LIKKLTLLSKRPFVRNVAAITGGTALAQAITMAFSPLITRIYGPEAFGVQGIFMSLAGIMTTIAALAYPIAIVLPKHDDDACGLARLSVYIGISMSLIATLVFWLFGRQLLNFLNSEVIVDFIYFIPLFMLFSVFCDVLGQWYIRKGYFKLTAQLNVWQSLAINIAKATVGMIYSTASVLIAINTLSNLFKAGLFLSGLIKGKRTESVVKRVKAQTSLIGLAKKHSDFPLLRAPQIFINTISHSLPVFMLAIFFGPTTVGFYALANMVLAMPSNLIGSSVMQVFYPKANEVHQKGESLYDLIIKTTLGMAAIGFLPFLIAIIWGPYIFEFVFGKGWAVAGSYAQWLSAWLFLGYLNKPAVAVIPVLGIQRGLLIYELISTGSKVVAIFLGYYFFKSSIIAVAFFALCGVVAYIYLIISVIFAAKKAIQ
jgi:O-antigen/teichoic acid export membrane protein